MHENEVRAMNAKQKEKLDQLEDELGVTRGTLPIRGQSEGYVFTEVEGITVLITPKSSNPRGGYIVPALRSYPETITPTNLDAAVGAKELFEKQIPDPDRKYGHVNAIVSMDWKCGNGTCPCSSEPPEPYERSMARSIGHPVSVTPKA